MVYIKKYNSPLGEIYLNSDGEYLTVLCFKNTMYYNRYIKFGEEKDLPIFEETVEWLDIYFSGKKPKYIPKYKRNYITPFRQEVIDEMFKIPYGKTTTYNDISKAIAKKKGINTNDCTSSGWCSRMESNINYYSMS